MPSAGKSAMDFILTQNAETTALLLPNLIALMLIDDLQINEIEILGDMVVQIGCMLLTVAAIKNAQRELSQSAAEQKTSSEKPEAATKKAAEKPVKEEPAKAKTDDQQDMGEQIRQLQEKNRELEQLLREIRSELASRN